MKIVSFNANGIRSAHRKDFFKWFNQSDIDVLCIQETKAQLEQLGPEITAQIGYESFFSDAEKKGYSGVAIYTKHTPDTVHHEFGWELADSEGRYIQVDLGNLSIASLYLPSGTSGDERQAIKMDFLDKLEDKLNDFQTQDREFILCGDWNIAHKEIDLKNFKGNKKNSGFLPEERAWLDKVFGPMNWVDAFRAINKEPDQYTWWSNRGQARAKNVGWRIDYQVISPTLKDKLKSVDIYTDEKFSDHAPLIMEYEL